MSEAVRTGRAPTVEDVARAAGVSRQTVSNVLNTPDIVREGTRERVRDAIRDLGYRPHAAARWLRTRRSSTIGIHLDPYAGGISGVVLDRFVHALTESASARGMRVLVYAARTPEEEIARIGDLLDGGEIDAVVITGTGKGDARTRFLTERGLPFVSFGRPWGEGGAEGELVDPSHPWVDVDGAAGTAAATAHLLATAGPRIAFLGWPEGSGTGDDRESGWRETLDAAGADGPRWYAEESVGAGRAAMAAALEAGDPVDGVVCASDSLAIGAHLAVLAAGGRGAAIVGFDNTPAAAALGIPSVEQLPERVAQGVLRLLMGDTGTVVAPQPTASGASHVLVTPELALRE